VNCGEQMEQIDIKIIKNKLFYNGYVMIKNKKRENVFYWECEKRSHKKEKNYFDYCNERMVTLLTNGKHVIRGKVPIHINHAPDASRLIVKTAIANINDIKLNRLGKNRLKLFKTFTVQFQLLLVLTSCLQ